MPVVADPAEEKLRELRGLVRRQAEDRPGVYRMVSEGGEVVYVGKSKRVRSRLMSYFRAGPSEIVRGDYARL